MTDAIGTRVRERITAVGLAQGEVARRAGLSDAQMSKSLHGHRQFSAAELACLAVELEVSMHWLATGQNDPRSYRIAARHEFDHANKRYSAANLAADQRILDDIALLYQQAYS